MNLRAPLLLLFWLMLPTPTLAADFPDPRYFHHRGGVADGYVSLADASLQAKTVAAFRHASLTEVRRMLTEHAEHPDGHPNALTIKVGDLNTELDRRFPLPGTR